MRVALKKMLHRHIIGMQAIKPDICEKQCWQAIHALLLVAKCSYSKRYTVHNSLKEDAVGVSYTTISAS
jgi:hypothetical protein